MYVCLLSHFSWLLSHFSRTLSNPADCSLPAPLSMGFSRQEYWSGLLCPPLGDLPDTGIEPMSLKSPALADVFFTTSTIWEACYVGILFSIYRWGKKWDSEKLNKISTSIKSTLSKKSKFWATTFFATTCLLSRTFGQHIPKLSFVPG